MSYTNTAAAGKCMWDVVFGYFLGRPRSEQTGGNKLSFSFPYQPELGVARNTDSEREKERERESEGGKRGEGEKDGKKVGERKGERGRF